MVRWGHAVKGMHPIGSTIYRVVKRKRKGSEGGKEGRKKFSVGIQKATREFVLRRESRREFHIVGEKRK